MCFSILAFESSPKVHRRLKHPSQCRSQPGKLGPKLSLRTNPQRNPIYLAVNWEEQHVNTSKQCVCLQPPGRVAHTNTAVTQNTVLHHCIYMITNCYYIVIIYNNNLDGSCSYLCGGAAFREFWSSWRQINIFNILFFLPCFQCKPQTQTVF